MNITILLENERSTQFEGQTKIKAFRILTTFLIYIYTYTVSFLTISALNLFSKRLLFEIQFNATKKAKVKTAEVVIMRSDEGFSLSGTFVLLNWLFKTEKAHGRKAKIAPNESKNAEKRQL